MPKLSNSVPKYRKHRGSGQAIVTLGGRDHYLGPHGTKVSKTQYDRLIAEWLASGRSPSFGATPEELSIAELLVAYLRHAREYYGVGPKSEFFHYRRVSRPIRDLYSGTAVSDFGPLQFKAVRQRLVSDGCSRPFINACMSRVARIFRWGAGEGLISATVPQALSTVDGLRRGRSEAPETKPILPVEAGTVDATLGHLPRVVADMVRLQRLTGARPAEICILHPCDLDRSSEVWTYQPETHKTQHHGRERLIFIGPKAQGVLLRYLARGAETYCFRPCDSEEKRRATLHAQRTIPLSYGNKPGSNRKRKPRRRPGESYTTDSYRRAIHRGCDKAFPHATYGCKMRSIFSADERAELKKWQSEHRWSPNQLRHSAATEIRREFGLEAAQVILGHSSADITQVSPPQPLTVSTKT